MDILVKLLTNRHYTTQANACFLLANMSLAESSIFPHVLQIRATKHFLKLLQPKNEVSVRAEIVGALKYLSSHLKDGIHDS